MKIGEGDILKVSKLARLELSAEESMEFSRQLTDIIEYVEKIGELPTDSVPPADNVVGLKNVVRQDVAGASLHVEDIEAVAPAFEERHFVVPRVIE